MWISGFLVFLCAIAMGQSEGPEGPAPPCPSDWSQEAYFATKDCTKFWQCSNGVPHLMPCSPGTEWNQELLVCTFPYESGCTGEGWSTTSSTASTTTTRTTTTTTQKPTTTTKTTLKPTTTTTTQKPTTTTKTTPKPTTTTTTQKPTTTTKTTPKPTTTTQKPTTTTKTTPKPTTTTTTTTTTKPTTTTTTTAKPTTTQKPPSNVPDCPKVDGAFPTFIPNPTNCSQFYMCSNGAAYLFNCTYPMTDFNPTLNVCDWPENAGCRKASSTEAPTTTTTPLPITTTEDPTEVPTELPTERPALDCPPVDGDYPTLFPNPTNCSQYYMCSNGVPYLFNCSYPLTDFNPALNVCDWPEKAGCRNASLTSTTVENNTTTAAPTTAVPTTVAPTTTEEPTEAPTESPLPGCPEVDGEFPTFIPHPTNCSQYYMCSNGAPYLFNCSAGLHFNPSLNVCDWSQNAGCGEPVTTIIPTTTESVTETTTAAAVETTTTDAPYVPEPECPTAETGAPPTLLPNPQNCSQYFICCNGVSYLFNCTNGLHFNPDTQGCDLQENAGCEASSTTSPVETTTSEASTTEVETTTQEKTTTDPSTEENTTNANTEKTTTDPSTEENTTDAATTNANTEITTTDPSTEENTTDAATTNANTEITTTDPSTEENTTDAATTNANTEITTTDPSTEENTTDAATTNANTEITTTDSNDEDTTTAAVTTTVSQETTTPQQCYCPCECPNPTTTTFWTTARQTETTTSNDVPTTTEEGSGEITTEDEFTTTTKDEASCDELSSQCPAVDGPDSVYIPLADCNKFCQCSNGKAYLHPCPAGLHFNPTLNVCDYPADAGCTGISGTTPTTSAKTESTAAQTEVPTTSAAETEAPTTQEPTTKAPTTHAKTTKAATTPAPSTDAPTTDAPTTEAEATCDQLSSQCPAVDGPDSVYIPLADCTKFCQCSNGKAYLHPCPAGLHFNPTLNVCDYPADAGCTGISGTTSTTTAKPAETMSLGQKLRRYIRSLF